MDKFEDWLACREVPAHRSNVMHRIIAQSQRPVCESLWTQTKRELLSVLVIPKPALALTATMMFGLVLGLQIDMQGNDIFNYGFETVMTELSVDDFAFTGEL